MKRYNEMGVGAGGAKDPAKTKEPAQKTAPTKPKK